MKTYIVSQRFETLGVPGETRHNSKQDAEMAADKDRSEIAEMVAEWETPETEPRNQTGFASEIEAWKEAAVIAGVEYDDNGDRTESSPKTYGLAAGQYIAEQAVAIEENED